MKKVAFTDEEQRLWESLKEEPRWSFFFATMLSTSVAALLTASGFYVGAADGKISYLLFGGLGLGVLLLRIVRIELAYHKTARHYQSLAKKVEAALRDGD